MPVLKKELVANVEEGVFFFRDAPHWHYAYKETTLLENISNLSYTFESEIEKINSVEIKNAGSSDIIYGYGSRYGEDYGGIRISNVRTLNLNFQDTGGSDPAILSTNSYAELDLTLKKLFPVRDILSWDVGQTDLTISHNSSDGASDVFGLKEEHYTQGDILGVHLQKESPYDTAGVLKTPNIANSYTLELNIDYPISNQNVVIQQGIGEIPIVSGENADLLPYLKIGDKGWLTFPITLVDVWDTPPTPTQANYGFAYRISDPDAVDFDTYYVVNSDKSAMVNKLTIPRLSDSKVRIDIEARSGSLYSISEFFINFENSAGELVNELLGFFDGIYPGCKVQTNFHDLTFNATTDNTLTLGTITNDWDTVLTYDLTDNTTILGDFSTISGIITATLQGTGYNFEEGRRIYIHQMSSKTTLPKNYSGRSPVIITDLLISDNDPVEAANIEYRLTPSAEGDRQEVEINGAINLVANPTFYKPGMATGIPGWEANVVNHKKDETGEFAWVHERSAELYQQKFSYLRQHIAGINPLEDYTLSFMQRSNNSTIKVKIYGFIKPEGFTDIDLPDVTNPDQVIEFDEITASTSFEKMAARVLTRDDFTEKGAIGLVNPNGNERFDDDITDIVIEIKKQGGTNSLYIDAVQLETYFNPTSFTNNYNYAVVEYETVDRTYSPRYKVGATDTTANKGFMVLDIDDPDFNDTGLLEGNLTRAGRERSETRFNNKIWGKLRGKNKYVQVSKFSRERKEFIGEYFLLPQVPTASSISFLGDTIVASMQTVGSLVKSVGIYGVLEDGDLNNLPNKEIEVRYGDTVDSLSNNELLVTNDQGIIQFPAPTLYQETLCPSVSVGLGGSALTSENTMFYSVSSMDSSNVYLVDATVNVGDLLFFFTTEGSYSNIFVATSAGTDASVTYDNNYNPIGGESSLSSYDYGMVIPSLFDVPKGYVQFPAELLFDAELTNNGSSVMTYQSGINNGETIIPAYNSSLTLTIERSREFISNDSYFNLDTLTFNPILNSIKIKDLDDPDRIFQQNFNNTNRDNGFFIDYANKLIKVSDLTVKNIEITFSPSMFFISPKDRRKVYVHPSLFSKGIKEIAASIEASDVKDMHNNTYGFPVEEITPFTQDLYFTLYCNASLHIKMEYEHLDAYKELNYRHLKPLV
jgi:hypothetical protein